jgi:hypothetical protein
VVLLHVISLRHTTLGSTSIEEGSASRRDLYLTTYNTHKRQTSIPPVEFEPAPPARERPQTYALDRAATHALFLMSKYFRMEQIKANCKKKRVSCHRFIEVFFCTFLSNIAVTSLQSPATVLFPCWLGRVASFQLSKLGGLDHRVT